MDMSLYVVSEAMGDIALDPVCSLRAAAPIGSYQSCWLGRLSSNDIWPSSRELFGKRKAGFAERKAR